MAMAIFILICSGVYYLYRGVHAEKSSEKIMLLGFAGLWFGLSLTRLFFYFSDYYIEGIYSGHVFLGDPNNVNPISEMLIKLGYISWLVGMLLFLLAFEIITKRMKYVLSIINIVLITTVIIFPFNLMRIVIYFYVFSDFGVLGSYDVELIAEKCTGCERCVNYCSLGAISMKDNLPTFNKTICIGCGGCEEFCPESAIRVKEMGYKVVVGGSGARHPQIAQTVTEFTDLDGALKILERTVNLIRDRYTEPMRVFTLSELISESGVSQLKE